MGLTVGCGGHDERASVLAPRWSPERISRLEERMPEAMRRWNVPGAALALVAEDRVQWARGFGRTAADEAIDASTVFQAASLGKPVFARLVALAADHLDRGLDEPLDAWIETDATNERLLHTTPRGLLSHTAGATFDAAAGRIVVDARSAGDWRYSGAGYVVLQAALERVLQRDLQSLAEDRIFGPLGMARSAYVTPADAAIDGHDRRGRLLDAMTWASANAGSSLYTTALDYGRFLQAVIADPGSTLDPIAVVDEELGLAWGLGWALERHPGRDPIAFHWGSNPGFKSFAMADPVRGLGVVILTNGDHGLELVEDAMAILDPMRHPMFDFYMMHPDD